MCCCIRFKAISSGDVYSTAILLNLSTMFLCCRCFWSFACDRTCQYVFALCRKLQCRSLLPVGLCHTAETALLSCSTGTNFLLKEGKMFKMPPSKDLCNGLVLLILLILPPHNGEYSVLLTFRYEGLSLTCLFECALGVELGGGGGRGVLLNGSWTRDLDLSDYNTVRVPNDWIADIVWELEALQAQK